MLKTFLVGVTVGTVLGVLYAPDKGSATRRKLSRTGNDIKDKINDLKETITDKIDSLKGDVNEMAYQELERIENEAAARKTWQED